MTDPATPPSDALQQPEHSHHPEAIAHRLRSPGRHRYLGDAVFGAIDGCVTTFAVVCGVVGGEFPATVALVLGFANLVADGFSMAVGNYEGSKSDLQFAEYARTVEERHIDNVPEGEREEVRQIFALKGFEGEVLDQIVDVITSDRDLWIDTMLQEEWGIHTRPPSPMWSAVVTFVAFAIFGAIPLMPYVVPEYEHAFTASVIATGVAFFSIGWLKGRVTDNPPLIAGLRTLATGAVAAGISYGIGVLLRALIDGGG